MESVYGHAYKYYYKYEEIYIKESIQYIKKNIKEHGLNYKILKDYNILNIGTGRESIAFQRLGAKHTFHLDISSKAVNSLKQYIHCNNIKNISTFKADICKNNIRNYIGDAEINYVFLDGIFHHLYNPKKALENIFKIVGDPCYIFMRNYLSGRWKWFIVYNIRNIIKYSDNSLVSFLYQFHNRFKIKSPQRNVIYREMYDDLFVPTLNLYRPADIDNYFMLNGFNVDNPRIVEEYNHNYEGTGSEAISLYYSVDNLTSVLKDSKKTFELIPVNQINDIKYDEKIILDNIGNIKRLKYEGYFKSAINRSIFCISLYRLSRKLFAEDNINKSSVIRHTELNELIENYILNVV